jgi:predicted DNA-binding transcriptional regulator AlpA
MTIHPRLIAIAVMILLSFAVLAALPDLAAVLFPPAQAKLTDPNIATAALATAAEPLAYSIRAFCRAHGISIPTYYELKKQKLGPKEMRLGASVRISQEAAAEWRKARENPSGKEAIAQARAADELRARAKYAAGKAIESDKYVSNRGTAR